MPFVVLAVLYSSSAMCSVRKRIRYNIITHQETGEEATGCVHRNGHPVRYLILSYISYPVRGGGTLGPPRWCAGWFGASVCGGLGAGAAAFGDETTPRVFR